MPFHLEDGLLAAYLDARLPAAERAQVDAHLHDCAECRAELVELGRLRRSLTRRSRRVGAALGVGVAVAAALLVLIGRPGQQLVPGDGADTAHRSREEHPVAPRGVAPVGRVARVSELVWVGVPGADRYRVTVFDSVGGLVWAVESSNTTIEVDGSRTFHRGRRYFWKVEARTGFDHWVGSEALEFLVAGRQ